MKTTDHARHRLIAAAHGMLAAGLNKGTAGNLSLRLTHNDENGENSESGFLITPSGMDYATLEAEDIVFMRFDGTACGRRQPSSEWRFHRDLYLAYPQAGAVLHAHSPFAVSLACLRWDIPPFHYMIARFGGDNIRCARYATFGTQALSDAALEALNGRTACLLANHGFLLYAETPERALALGIEFEALCEQYWRACQLGAPVLLDADEMAVILKKFAHYGQPQNAK